VTFHRLKLVEIEGRTESPPNRRTAAVGWTAGLLALALLATALGADRARRSTDARGRADGALRLALERGNDDPTVRRELQDLRRPLARRPLDSRTRVAYAAVLAGLATTTRDLEAAAFHARAAASLAPVTVPVVRGAVLVLVRSGSIEPALESLRGMFSYDAPAAARLLLEIEPLVPAGRAADVPVASPTALLAWSRVLDQAGRREEADAVLVAARSRWPADLDLLVEAAARAYRTHDLPRLGKLLGPELALPRDRRAGMLHTYRALVAARLGDANAARSDVERALDLDPDNTGLRILAGDALETLGAIDDAVALWTAVRFTAQDAPVATRVAALRRLARVDERRSRAGSALRLWREVLALAPADPEAERRVAALTGASP
jgi:tetratricopeptide (TPR) repeat protein